MAHLILYTDQRLGAIPADFAAKLTENVATNFGTDSSNVFVTISANQVMSIGPQADGGAAMGILKMSESNGETSVDKVQSFLEFIGTELQIPVKRISVTIQELPDASFVYGESAAPAAE